MSNTNFTYEHGIYKQEKNTVHLKDRLQDQESRTLEKEIIVALKFSCSFYMQLQLTSYKASVAKNFQLHYLVYNFHAIN